MNTSIGEALPGRWKTHFGNFFGAFADGATLFPILVLLNQTNGMPAFELLATTGIVYIAAAWFFRMPMAVQPLKSLAMAAVTLKATELEIRWAGGLVGACCLVLVFFSADRFLKKIPEFLIHGLQAGLGVLLVLQGFKGLSWNHYGPLILGTLGLVGLPLLIQFPLLGMASLGGMIWGLASASSAAVSPAPVTEISEGLRWALLASLVLPQIPLTLANSVVATSHVGQRFFPRAQRLNPRSLLFFLGAGNLINSICFGGLPFCHGSGGVTAHKKGGATGPQATVLLGGILLLLALFSLNGNALSWNYPRWLLGVLLATNGVHHMALALPSLKKSGTPRWTLLLMGITTYVTGNLAAALAAGLTLWGLHWTVSEILKPHRLSEKAEKGAA